MVLACLPVIHMNSQAAAQAHYDSAPRQCEEELAAALIELSPVFKCSVISKGATTSHQEVNSSNAALDSLRQIWSYVDTLFCGHLPAC